MSAKSRAIGKEPENLARIHGKVAGVQGVSFRPVAGLLHPINLGSSISGKEVAGHFLGHWKYSSLSLLGARILQHYGLGRLALIQLG